MFIFGIVPDNGGFWMEEYLCSTSVHKYVEQPEAVDMRIEVAITTSLTAILSVSRKWAL